MRVEDRRQIVAVWAAVASDLKAGENQLDAEEVGLISRAFKLGNFEDMLKDGTIRDATTVAAYGLLRLKGML